MNKIRFYPVINFITGPPGVVRNGGIWRWIKKEFINNGIPQFMTQVLHFVDFPVTKKTFDKWFSNGETLKDWIKKEKNEYNPKIFTDSGGFKLLYNKEYELSEFGIEPTQDKIFRLQLKYGADFVASLDYPIPPSLNKKETEERMEKSIKNCIKLMQLIYDSDYITSKDVFPYLAIHGRHSFEFKLYIEKLFNELEENGFYDESFGLALGSLVPVKNHYELLIEITHAVEEALQEYNKKISVHIFGISGYVIPFLAYLGIKSFDSNTYIQTAQNLKFLTPNFLQKKFYEINEEDLNLCGCRYCQYLLNGGIGTAKRILREKGNRTFKFNGETITKSTIYAFIAMHNLNVQLRMINTLNRFKNRDSTAEWLINYSKGRNKASRLITKISRVDEILHNIVVDNKMDTYKPRHEFYYVSTQRKIKLNINPNAFNINNIHDYLPKDKKIMLILPCTVTKPYFESRTYRYITNFLEKKHISIAKIEIVTLSGMFGPVPQKYEQHPAVLEYEYILSTRAKTRINLIIDRLQQFLERYQSKFNFTLAYITSRPYRQVIDLVNKKYKLDIILLPKKVRRAVSSELLRKENLEELLEVMRKLIN